MFLENLSLYNFKNYEELHLAFSGKIQVFLGNNGSGKTNLLDALYYLSFTKSALNLSDSQNIRHTQEQFVIKGSFRAERKMEVTCSFQTGHKKIIRENEQEPARLSDHIGKYPVVLVAPNDIELIWDGSEMRRKFFDTLISQIDKTYLENLIAYQYYLKQRNGLLRLFNERGQVDHDLLETYDGKLVPLGKFIYEKRRSFLEEFFPRFQKEYRFLAGEEKEEAGIVYQSDGGTSDFKDLLTRNLTRDLQLQRTGSGIHRDDFNFLLNGYELKRYGSQGQQKSFLIALKLAEFESISAHKKKKPLLLLDDIFDKLDDLRIRKLMRLVADDSFGQLFITDARANRSKEIFAKAGVKGDLLHVNSGKVSPFTG